VLEIPKSGPELCFAFAARFILNANYSVVRPAVKLRVTDRIVLTASGSPYHSRPNGSASEIRINATLSLRGRTSLNVCCELVIVLGG
jgi:hypothetical protein